MLTPLLPSTVTSPPLPVSPLGGCRTGGTGGTGGTRSDRRDRSRRKGGRRWSLEVDRPVVWRWINRSGGEPRSSSARVGSWTWGSHGLCRRWSGGGTRGHPLRSTPQGGLDEAELDQLMGSSGGSSQRGPLSHEVRLGVVEVIRSSGSQGGGARSQGEGTRGGVEVRGWSGTRSQGGGAAGGDRRRSGGGPTCRTPHVRVGGMILLLSLFSLLSRVRALSLLVLLKPKP